MTVTLNDLLNYLISVLTVRHYTDTSIKGWIHFLANIRDKAMIWRENFTE